MPWLVLLSGLSAGLQTKGSWFGSQFVSRQGTSLGCGPGLQWGVCERQSHMDVSLPLFLPPFPSLSK